MEWIIIFGLASSCYVIHKMINYCFEYKGTSVTKGWSYLFGWIVVVSVFVPYYFYIESTSIKDGGIYYVNLFEKLDAQKNYRVPGLIYKDEYGYHLGEVYWSNGGSLSFDTSSSYTDLIVGEKVIVSDDEQKQWYIELTNKKVLKK